MRDVRGCHGKTQFTPTRFRGTDIESTTCPRRTLINNRWVVGAFELYNLTEGKLGLKIYDMPQSVATSIACIDEGKAIKESLDKKD